MGFIILRIALFFLEEAAPSTQKVWGGSSRDGGGKGVRSGCDPYSSLSMTCWHCNIWLRILWKRDEKCTKNGEICTCSQILNLSKFAISEPISIYISIYISRHIWIGILKYFKSIPMRGWYCNIWLRNWGNGVERFSKNGEIIVWNQILNLNKFAISEPISI